MSNAKGDGEEIIVDCVRYVRGDIADDWKRQAERERAFKEDYYQQLKTIIDSRKRMNETLVSLNSAANAPTNTDGE